MGITDHDVERKVLAAPVQMGDLIEQKGRVYKVEDMTPGIFMAAPGSTMGKNYDFIARDGKGGILPLNFIDYGRTYAKTVEAKS